jgi:uncharacterized flavoprotein (TIGR03862 family)
MRWRIVTATEPATAVVPQRIAIVGGGPAGLMAAEVLAGAGLRVDVYDAMPSVARKFLLAGRGGLNLTHAEAPDVFVTRYGNAPRRSRRWLDEFGPQQLRNWAQELGIATFVGSSGRVFPQEMKAAPLLRAWLHRLRAAGVASTRAIGGRAGMADGALRFATPAGEEKVGAGATVLALGGGSWAKLGSDGAWVPLLAARGVKVERLRPANCGFDVAWSEHMKQRFAGTPVKNVGAALMAPDGSVIRQEGEFLVTEHGVEGNLVYALSAPLRDRIETGGSATLHVDLVPGRDLLRLTQDLAHPRGRDSLANHLRRRAGISGVKAALLHEYATPADLAAHGKARRPDQVAAAAPGSPRPLDEAISSAGGVDFAALDENLMLRNMPGTFCAGEMLDWEAPTGGYLLTACFASGRAAGLGVLRWLQPATGRPQPMT